ncbi:hypothetical protein KM043_011900 [Ampulex compressa]|nr:hypothetical protein KM043_011900 [Ampulex compressa]
MAQVLPFLLPVLFLGAQAIRESIRPQHGKEVHCYVVSWAIYRQNEGKFTVDNIRPELCTHIIYSFAGLDAETWTIKSLDEWADINKNNIGNYRRVTALRQKYPGLKVTLAIGGWNEGSKNYSNLAGSATSRKIFVKSVVDFLRKFEFDGLDLDWEYPTQREGVPADRENFVHLIKELKEAFKGPRPLLLSAAISAVKYVIDSAYDVPEISKYLDYIHIMAYDYHGVWNKKVLPNSPLRGSDELSVEDTVKHLLQKGAPPEKLILGLAMYGRTFTVTTKPSSPDESPLGLPITGDGFAGPFTNQSGFMGYNEICSELITNSQSWRIGWDEESSTPYAINDDRVIVYDNPRGFKAKIEYINGLGLAGVMVWSMDTDDFSGKCKALHYDSLNPLTEMDFPLLRTINKALTPKEDSIDDNSVENPSLATKASSNLVLLAFILLIYPAVMNR